MQNEILYTPEQIVLDLSQADLGHPDGLRILRRHYRQSEHPSMGFSKARPAFVCLTHKGGANPGLYLKKRNGEWWAVHYESGVCASKRLPAPMSDEHKRQTEYWARAAQDVGYRVELEHNLHTGTRPDALIHGRFRPVSKYSGPQCLPYVLSSGPAKPQTLAGLMCGSPAS